MDSSARFMPTNKITDLEEKKRTKFHGLSV